MNFRKLLAGALVSACTVAAASNAPLANYDRYQVELASAAPVRTPSLGGQFKAQFSSSKTTVPSFLWAAADAKAIEVGPIAAASLADARARQYLRLNASVLQLTEKRIADARLFNVHDLGHGPITARYQQSVNGIDVFGRQLNVLMTRDSKPVAISGAFAAAADPAAGSFSLRPQDAIVAAGSQLGLSLNLAALTPARQQGAYQWFNFGTAGTGLHLSRQPRVKSVYYPSTTGLIPAYYVELFTGSGNGSQAYSFVMSANDGSLLFRNNLKANDAGTAYSYRVFADADGIKQPFDQPLGNGFDPFPGTSITDVLPRPSATANLVTLANGPISTNDPWLAANATTTTGNNVDSFLDTGIILGIQGTYVVTDGYQANTGDLRTSLTSANTFDYAIKADDDPSQNIPKNAAIVNLFYMNNWLHDWWYDHGFDEVSGNGQTSNFGRGGSEGDPISAEGQDASGRDNSNMSTPADGSSPTEQMFLFDGAVVGEVRQLTPVDSGKLTFTTASFGPTTFDVTGTAVLANENSGPSMTDGCSAVPALPVAGTTTPAPPDVALLNKIALIDRGTCSFTTKEQFATLSGATAMVVINNADGPPILMGNADLPTLPVNLPIPTTDQVYTLPAVMITKADGDILKAMIAAGKTITMHVQREPSIDFDGTLDEQIIAHEFFHHVSNRLVNDANGLTNTQGGGMGEGWSDFDALLLSARPDDRQVAGNDRYQGAYALAFYAIPGIVPVSYYYFGIRRAPYSTDSTKNALTFKYIQDGVALPTTSPFAFGQDGATNSEVHNVGEIWSNTLWNCYVGLLNDPRHSFVEARSRMMDYVIGGLKMTPTAPTILQARDGVLAVVKATDAQDYAECSHGFAVRGMGLNAVSPASSSTDNSGVVENFDEFVTQAVNTAPTAALTATPTSGTSPLTVAFDASTSSDPDAGDGIASYTFDFNDGTAAVTQATATISHTYTVAAGAAPATYAPTVVVTDKQGASSTNTASVSIQVSAVNQAPTAVLTATPVSGTAPLVVNLDGSGSSDPDSGDKVASYSFDFGDGSAAVVQTTPAVSHTYSTAGSYAAKLTVTDSHGAVSSAAQQTITVTAATVPNAAPTASLKATPISGTAPLVVNLDGSASSDPDSGDSISTYAFTFGDGSAMVTQTAAMISHTYSTAGTYTASLTVTDSHGLSSTNTAQQTITVTAPATTVNTAPVARMTATPTTGTVALTVKFDGSTSSDADSGDGIANYRFDFGDGSAVVTQITAAVSHTYNSVGSYTATLTVMDTHAATSAAPASVVVTVNAAAVAETPTENRLGGGAFGLPALLVLGSLAAVGRRRRKSVA